MTQFLPYAYAFFASVVIFVVYYIGKNILAGMRHIDQEVLVEFWNGRLRNRSEAEYRLVVNHLASCEDCRDRLDEITQNSKTRHNVDEGIIVRKF